MDTITNSNYKQLLIEEKELVEYEQHIVFDYNGITYNYEVCNSFLLCNNYTDNCEIFNALGLDKYSFCTKHYGYKTNVGDFPICEEVDYPALTRVVIALFEEIESRTESPKEEISIEETKPEKFKLNVSLIDSKVTIRI